MNTPKSVAYSRVIVGGMDSAAVRFVGLGNSARLATHCPGGQHHDSRQVAAAVKRRIERARICSESYASSLAYRVAEKAADWAVLAPQFDGKFRVPTLRNVDMRPYPSFVKAIGLGT